MKKITYLLIFSLLLITACEDVQPTFSPASLTVTASKSEIVVNGMESITLTVRDEKRTDVTDLVSLYLGNEKLESAVFKPTAPGELKFFAKFENVVSPTIIVTALPENGIYTKKVLAEDYTGAWCGYCPRVAYKLDVFQETNTNLIAVAVHNNDALAFNKEGVLRTEYNVTGFPTVIINRNFKWQEINSQINTELQSRALAGLAIESSLSGSSVNVTVKVGFEIDMNEPLSLVVFLVENKVVLPQANYMNNDPSSPWYQRGTTIQDFEHNHVLRKSATDVFGDAIPAEQTKKAVYYQKSYTFSLDAAYNSTNCEIVAFVMYSVGSSAKKGVLNVQKTKVGSNKNFD